MLHSPFLRAERLSKVGIEAANPAINRVVVRSAGAFSALVSGWLTTLRTTVLLNHITAAFVRWPGNLMGPLSHPQRVQDSDGVTKHKLAVFIGA